jgi:hypothetical protein
MKQKMNTEMKISGDSKVTRFVYILRTWQGGKFVVVPGTHVYRQSVVIDQVPAT